MKVNTRWIVENKLITKQCCRSLISFKQTNITWLHYFPRKYHQISSHNAAIFVLFADCSSESRLKFDNNNNNTLEPNFCVNWRVSESFWRLESPTPLFEGWGCEGGGVLFFYPATPFTNKTDQTWSGNNKYWIWVTWCVTTKRGHHGSHPVWPSVSLPVIVVTWYVSQCHVWITVHNIPLVRT